MEVILTIVIIAALFGLLSFTPMFQTNSKSDAECDETGESSGNCSTCGIVGSCSAAAENLPS